MARHHGFDLAQRGGAGELAVQQHKELMAGRKASRPIVGPIFVDQSVERRPRNEFEDVVQNAIRVAHGVDPFFVSR